jgi:hypothetical protein
LPAGWYFHLRYGLPTNLYRDAQADRFYVRNRNLQWATRDYPMTDGPLRSLAHGLAPADKGMGFHRRRATVLLMAEWPYLTEIRVDLRSPAAGRLRAGFGGWLGARWLGDAPIAGTDVTESLTFKVPPGVFDSGLVELALDLDGPTDGSVVVENVHFDDTTPYPSAY